MAGMGSGSLLRRGSCCRNATVVFGNTQHLPTRARAFLTVARSIDLPLKRPNQPDRRSLSYSPKFSQQQQLRLDEEAVDENFARSQKQQRDGKHETLHRYDNISLQRLDESSDPVREHVSFRELMRFVTHPVAIITSADIKVDERGGPISWRGATVSSFNSVTLHPEPYVSFNIKRLSSTYEAIRSSNMFAAHILSETLKATEMATHFSRGNEVGPFFVQDTRQQGNENLLLQPFVSNGSGGKAWDGYQISIEYNRLPPYLQWESRGTAKAVLFHVLCQYQAEKTIHVGDHVVVVGKVLGFDTKGTSYDNVRKEPLQSLADQKCLTYSNGQYNMEGTGLTT